MIPSYAASRKKVTTPGYVPYSVRNKVSIKDVPTSKAAMTKPASRYTNAPTNVKPTSKPTAKATSKPAAKKRSSFTSRRPSSFGSRRRR